MVPSYLSEDGMLRNDNSDLADDLASELSEETAMALTLFAGPTT